MNLARRVYPSNIKTLCGTHPVVTAAVLVVYRAKLVLQARRAAHTTGRFRVLGGKETP